MLFRKNIVSTQTLFLLMAALLCVVGGAGTAFAANSGIAPLLVPYTITTIAGNPQYPTGTTSLSAGYFGEGVPGTSTASKVGATMNGPYAMAMDSVGNLYITDTGNDIIREVNAQTGLITTIGGVVPTGCSGVTCTVRTTGCADGALAAGSPLGAKLDGIAVDAYGNVYFVDNATNSASVIYRAGAQVAAFIALVDPGTPPVGGVAGTGVANTNGVAKPGYVYHIAGQVNLSSCSSASGAADNLPAFQNTGNSASAAGAQLHGPTQITLDSAGNIYIADISNFTTRVINTQATPQTFFQYTVQPGYMRSITDCNALLTIPCPTATTTSTLNTGINGPVNGIVFNSQFKMSESDAFGNLYQLNGTGSGTGLPGIYSATAYAGGAPLTNLMVAEAPSLATSFGPGPGNAPAELNSAGLPTYGNSYITIGNPAITSALPSSFPDILATTNEDLDIRPSSLLPDVFGTFWFLDNHYPEFERIDQYTSLATDMVGTATMRATSSVAGISGVTYNGAAVNYLTPASFTNPWYCVYGSSAHPWSAGPVTYDPEGDGCPSIVGRINGNYNSISDGLGNIILGDGGEHLIRELPLGNSFPATAVNTTAPVTQAIQVHFNSNNPPQIGSAIPDSFATGNTTTSFSITGPANPDFTINTTTPEFPLGALITSGVNAYGNNSTTNGNFQMWAGLPTCTQLGLYPTATSVTDYDCLVYVTFSPVAPGLRQAQLVATTANGSVYNFELSGLGVGGQLAIDGGAPTPQSLTGLGKTAGIAVSSTGTLYVADPANNRIVVQAPNNGLQSTLALSFPACPAHPILGVQCGVTPTTLSGPMGVAVDAANNVYISDTGNNRVLEVNGVTGVATVLGNNVWVSGAAAGASGASVTATTAPPQYAFKAPQGLAVDSSNNVYVADTGNGVVVEIPSNIALGGAVPLLAYTGAPTFSNPVAVAVDSIGNVYVADTLNPTGQIVVLPPGGGDLQPANILGSNFTNLKGSALTSPNGVAVDAAGNVYVSDSGSNQIMEFPGGSGSHALPFPLNFPNVSSPAGLALDPSGNLYVADSGNKQVLMDNRQSPMVSFGTVPQFQSSVATLPLTITNIGSQSVPIAASFAVVQGTPSAAFSVANNSCSTSSQGGPLAPGTTCSISASFNPTADGPQMENISINNNTGQIVQLNASGEQPLANVVLSAAYSSGTTPAAGVTATITATVTQPHVAGDTPTGTVAFSYTIQGDGTTGTANGTLTGSGGTATASFTLPTLLQGRRYTINAVYTSTDSLDTSNSATPLVLYVPGVAVTATATSVTFQYGKAVPAITGTVTGITDSSVKYTFTSAATSTSPIGTYPIQVVFTGGTYLNYGFPPVVTSSGAPAVVTETAAPLTYSIPNFSNPYGAPPINYGANATITGILNGDKFSATFTPPDSSILNVGTYSVVPTVTGNHVGNYAVTAAPSTLTVTPAPSGVTVAAAQTAVLNTSTGVASASILVNVGSLVVLGKGIPTGTVTVTDNFTPITLTAPGTGTPVAPVTSTLNLVAGSATYVPTNTTPGTHLYSFTYNGDSNFQCSVVGQAATTSPACPTVGTTATKLLVDNPDFTLSSSTGVINVVPGVVPSGNGLPPASNQSAGTPESAVITIAGVLGFSGNISVTCATQNPSYVSCTMTPPLITLTASGSGASTASVLSVQTPLTLPLGFFSSVKVGPSATRTVLAFLPFGVLAFCVRRRRRLSKALWMLIAIAAVGAGMQGCGGNQTAFYTPIPTGPQTVTVTATFAGSTSIPAQTRSFIVPISIN